MVLLGLEGLRGNLADLLAVVTFNDRIRKHFAEDGDLSSTAKEVGAANYVAAKGTIPDQAAWRVYDHCAFITRLYAVYESYVYELVRLWLDQITRVLPAWVDLPQSLSDSYRAGVGVLLQKYGGPRTEHLTEMGIIEGLHAGLSGLGHYTLLPDAFFVDLQNLRESELAHLCARVGLPDAQKWLVAHPTLVAHCTSNSFTVTSGLKDFVEYRNEAAHGATHVDEVLGFTECRLLHEFIDLLCEALGQFVLWNLCREALARDVCQQLGTTTEYFKRPDASIITMTEAELTLGDILVIRGPTECYQAHILSLQVNGTNVESVRASNGQEIGVRLDRTAKVGMDILRLHLS